MKLFKFLVALSLWVAMLVFAPKTGRTHEPITTKVMFNKEIIRILDRNCLGCHAPGKIKADIPLTTYEEARPWAKAIKEEVLEKRMMPYQAVRGYGSFAHNYTLKQRDLDLLISWIDGGAPRGEAKDYPAEKIQKLIAGSEWALSVPDLILQPEQELGIVAESSIDARCVVLPLKLQKDRFLRGLDFQPGNGTIVYSASFAIESGSGKESCFPATQAFAHWAPGQAAIQWPEGIGQRIPAGSNIAMRIVYRTNGEPAKDRSRIGLYFAGSPNQRPVQTIEIAPTAAISLPAGASDIRARAIHRLSEAADIVAIRPMLFPFGKSIEATAYRPDGTTEVLIWTRDYRFDWQPSYFFKKPVSLPRGTRIEVTAYFDNSDENPNNPNDPPAEIQINKAFCEITLTSASLPKRSPIQQARQ